MNEVQHCKYMHQNKLDAHLKKTKVFKKCSYEKFMDKEYTLYALFTPYIQ